MKDYEVEGNCFYSCFYNEEYGVDELRCGCIGKYNRWLIKKLSKQLGSGRPTVTCITGNRDTLLRISSKHYNYKMLDEDKGILIYNV
jgi:hypothetical protein